MAPSLYEYQNTQEWEQAMQEWCMENEPQFTLRYYDYSIPPYGNWVDMKFHTFEEAKAFGDTKVTDFDKPIILATPHGKWNECVILRPWGEGGDGKYDRGITNRFGDYAILRIR